MSRGRMAMVTLAAVLALVAGAAATGPADETPTQRAQRNAELLLRGEKQVGDLSEAERRELAAAEALARGGPDKRTPTERCRADEIKRAGGQPSELELRIIGLKCSQR